MNCFRTNIINGKLEHWICIYIHTINKWKVLYKGNQNATRHTIMKSYSFKYYQRVFSPEFLPTNNYKHTAQGILFDTA